MKLNIDWEDKTITLLGDWNLYELFERIENIIGIESEEHNKWTVKQEIKIVIVPKEIYIPTTPSPLGQPYKPLYDINKVICGLENKHTPIMQQIIFNTTKLNKEDLKTNTYSHT